MLSLESISNFNNTSRSVAVAKAATLEPKPTKLLTAPASADKSHSKELSKCIKVHNMIAIS